MSDDDIPYNASKRDIPYSIQETSDGGFIVAGNTGYTYYYSDGKGQVFGITESYNIWVLRLNSDGDIIWQKKYKGSDDDGVISIKQTSDGGFIMAEVQKD